MQKETLKADTLLLLTALIWGFAFVAQRVGMEYVGPFTFNGVRFALGSLSLLPLIIVTRKKRRSGGEEQPTLQPRTVLGASILAGLVLFLGASFQQVGIVYTTAGKAGFITGMYVILVPIIGSRWGQKTTTGTWIGAILAITGLYLLSMTGNFTISKGDLLVLISAFFWAGHVLLLGWLSPKTDSLVLASTQFAVCSVLSMMTAFGVEAVTLESIIRGAVPILYGGLMSVGVAYTLQVVAQRTAHPAHASVILTLEGAFAAIGGWLILGEILSIRSLVGCALMLLGMLVSQSAGYLFPKREL